MPSRPCRSRPLRATNVHCRQEYGSRRQAIGGCTRAPSGHPATDTDPEVDGRPCGRLNSARSKPPPKKPQITMGVLIVAGGHAPPPLEPAAAACPGVARRVPFRGVRLGVRSSAPDRKDGLEAPLRDPGAEGVAASGPIRDQAGQGRAGPGFHQGPGLGAVVARAARHAPVRGRPCRSVRLGIWVRKPPRLRPRAGSISSFWSAPAALTCMRTTVLSRRTADQSGSACL